MMQAAEDGHRFDAAKGMNRSPRRRILVQGQVWPMRPIVDRDVLLIPFPTFRAGRRIEYDVGGWRAPSFLLRRFPWR